MAHRRRRPRGLVSLARSRSSHRTVQVCTRGRNLPLSGGGAEPKGRGTAVAGIAAVAAEAGEGLAPERRSHRTRRSPGRAAPGPIGIAASSDALASMLPLKPRLDVPPSPASPPEPPPSFRLAFAWPPSPPSPPLAVASTTETVSGFSAAMLCFAVPPKITVADPPAAPAPAFPPDASTVGTLPAARADPPSRPLPPVR